MATRLATERARPEDLEALGCIVGAMDAAVAEDHNAEWADLNSSFHLAVSALPGLDMLRI